MPAPPSTCFAELALRVSDEETSSGYDPIRHALPIPTFMYSFLSTAGIRRRENLLLLLHPTLQLAYS